MVFTCRPPQDPEPVHQPSGIPASSAIKVPPPLPPRAASTGAAADTGSEEESGAEGVCATEPDVGYLGEGGGDGEPLPDSFVPGKIVHIYRQENGAVGGVFSRFSLVSRRHRSVGVQDL